jgi:hypothetical protein
MRAFISQATAIAAFTLLMAEPGSAYCNKVGIICQHTGFWNVYVSIPGGDAWGEDYTGSDPATEIIQANAQKVVRRLWECGIDGQITNSSWVEGFRRNLVIVLAGPYGSASSAASELRAAQNCGLTGYTKFGVWNEPGGE